MSYLTMEEATEATARGADLAFAATPDFIAAFHATIDEWVDEHTTLTGTRKKLFAHYAKRGFVHQALEDLLKHRQMLLTNRPEVG